MTFDERRDRDRLARRRLITSTARSIAEREGWGAVTTRRLSAEIEFSQPVIYKHFASLGDITDAVAEDGFDELANALREARIEADPGDAVRPVARRYADFADHSPSLYDAMFVRSSGLPFGADPPAALSVAFAEMRAALEPHAGDTDLDVLTETLWAALHGLVVLGRSGRLRPANHLSRVDLVANRFTIHAG